MKKYELIIPMAGKGQRFIDAGYTTPKPFLPIRTGTNIIDRIMFEFKSASKVHLVTREPCQIKEWSEVNNVTVRNRPQYGQLHTVMEAIPFLQNDTGVIIANSDNIVEEAGWVERWLQKIEKEKPDGSICLMWGEHPKWSYAEIKNNTIVRTAEKDPISEHATCGYYYFKNKEILTRAAETAVKDENNKINGEWYVCPIYNSIIKQGGVVMPYWLNNFVGLGTPEDYERYLNEV
jgi:NDP-sugar pyrophosphorylase family protein